MKLATVFLAILTRLICVENSILPRNYIRNMVTASETEPTRPYSVLNFDSPEPTSEEDEHRKVVEIKTTEEEEYSFEYDKEQLINKLKEPCAIVVLSNTQSATMQSLLRKYKYDSKGALIPSSVKYFMKVPQGYGEPILVPLNDKTFSHLGGYVRYYKEVPPIPQAW